MNNFLFRGILPLALSLPMCLPAQNDTLTRSDQPVFIALTDSTPGFTLTWTGSFPSIDSVAQKFSKTYGNQAFSVSFEKRKEGYFVATYDYENYAVLRSRELFWSATDGQWKPLSMSKEMPDKAFFDPYYNEYYYQRVPYYGYEGWYRDVIAELESRSSLNADERFSLATAWYERTTHLLSDRYYLADSVETFILPDRKNALSPEQLEIYFSYMQKSLEQYEILAEEHPDYETIVGSARVKLANVNMAFFMQVHYYQNEETAFRILDNKQLTYPDFLLESARNLLKSCAPNAILFTYGDNDTYPLWYVQAKESFRRDVVVANLNLIATGRYLNHLRTSVFGAKPLRFQLPAAFYFGPESNYIRLKEAKYPTAVSELFQCLVAKGKASTACGTPLLEFYTDQSGKHLPEGQALGRYNNKISIHFESAYGLFRDEFALLDILYSNAPERPVYFAMTGRIIFKPFMHHLVQEGMVCRFQPRYQVPSDTDMRSTLGEKASRRLFLETYAFKSQDSIRADGLPFLNLYQVGILKTAQAYQKKGKRKPVIQLLDQYFAAFPNGRTPFDVSTLFYAEVYTKVDRIATSSAIVNQVLDNFLAGKISTLDIEIYVRLMKRIALLNKDLALQGRLKLLWPD